MKKPKTKILNRCMAHAKFMKGNKGITLVALIVTIIILLILAGVTISTLSNSGLFGKTQQSAFEAKKAQYIEDVKLSIMTVQLEMSKAGEEKETTKTRTAKVTNRSGEGNSEQEEKVFITELKNKILELKWVDRVEMADSNGIEHTGADVANNTILIVTSKDRYEILVNVNNGTKTAEVNEESFGEQQEPLTVAYDSNGGSGEVASQQVRRGFTAILKENSFTPAQSNYHFAGWCLTENGEEKITRIDNVTENITVYATWEQNIVTVSYNSNNGTGEIATANVGQGNSYQIELNNNQIYRTGYELNGWNTEADGSGTAYADGATIEEVNGNITLYAQWLQTYEITYDANGGSVNPTSQSGVTGSSITMPTPTRNGYVFKGWYTETSGGTKVEYTTMPSANKTLHAQWYDNDYAVGDTVTIKNKDGVDQLFYVIENSDSSNSEVKLLSAMNVNTNTNVQENATNPLEFDSGTNIYYEEATIKGYVDTYANSLNVTIEEKRLMTAAEVVALGATANYSNGSSSQGSTANCIGNMAFVNASDYWLETYRPYGSVRQVWGVLGSELKMKTQEVNVRVHGPSGYWDLYGLRPVIIVLKSNI